MHIRVACMYMYTVYLCLRKPQGKRMTCTLIKVNQEEVLTFQHAFTSSLISVRLQGVLRAYSCDRYYGTCRNRKYAWGGRGWGTLSARVERRTVPHHRKGWCQYVMLNYS